MSHRLSKRRAETISALAAFGLLAILVVDPVAAQPWADSGGESQLNEFATNFIPWAMRWLTTIGAFVFSATHLWASWTSNEDKSFRRKEWRNRAGFALATLIPILIVINGIIVAFGGEPLDFFPFI